MQQWDADTTIWSPRHNGVRNEKRIAVILHTDESAYNHATGQIRMTGWTVDQLGRYNAEPTTPMGLRGSYHLGVDDSARTVRMVNDRGGTWSTGNQGNNRAIHVCMAGTTAHWTREQWLSKPRLLNRTAEVVAHELKYHGLPAHRLNADDLQASRLGWGGHGDCTVAWGSSSNWDPGGYAGRYTAGQLTLAGGFPWDHMQTLIDKHMTGQAGGFLMALTDAEQRELLDKTRRIDRELTQLYPSRSAYAHTDKPIDTLAGYVLNTDARQHELWVQEQADREGIDPAAWAAKHLGGTK